MKIVLTLLVRDEADIVADMLDFHFDLGVDHVIATDHLSADGTRDILREYQRTGRLTLLEETDPSYDQGRYVTRMARMAAAEHGADWVMNADADEFWTPASGDLRQLFATVDTSVDLVTVHRFDFVPRPENGRPLLERMRWRRTDSMTPDGHPMGVKVAHRGHPKVEVAVGNHDVSGLSGRRLDDGSLQVLHFPLRTLEQFDHKIEVGTEALRRTSHFGPDAGWHWRDADESRREGRLAARWDAWVYDDERIQAGLSDGTLVEDRRLLEARDRRRLVALDPEASPGDGTPTPVRSLFPAEAVGSAVCLLRDPQSGYRDGGEGRVLDVIRQTHDLGSASDEMLRSARTWAEQYHLTPDRGNILRGLDLPPDAKVLEIGAGCGAVTRYLGETCAIVDALEPVPTRAMVIRERCRDLESVAVFVGELDDVPSDAAYDVIVVIGVLEYVAAGADDDEAYVDFLAGIAQRLVPGGTLVLAIENKLGVKYLVGAPEDHTLRPFDSLENYPTGGQARTFSRLELSTLLHAVGLNPGFYGAFPDYKLPRVILGTLPDSARSLYHRIPRFPSPDWLGDRPKLADEHLTWRTLVDAGFDVDFANSFLVIAVKGDQGPALWPAGRVASFFSASRRPRFATQTDVDVVDEETRFRRGPMRGQATDLGAEVLTADYPYCDGRDFLEIVARDDTGTPGLLARWRRQVDDAATIDHVPHNLVVTSHGDLVLVDNELPGAQPATRVVPRGIYWLAVKATAISPPDRWPTAETVRDVATELGTHVGLDSDGHWIEQFVLDEADLQAEVCIGPPDTTSPDLWRASMADELRQQLDRPLDDLPVGSRLPAIADGQVTRLTEDLDHARAELQQLRAALTEITGSSVMQVAGRYRTVIERTLPTGTARRRAYGKALRLARRIAGRMQS